MEKQIAFGVTHLIKEHKQHSFLVGRLMVVTKVSKKEGFVNGHLYNPKTGETQRSEIAIPYNTLEPIYLPVVITKPKRQPLITPEVIALPAPKEVKAKKERVKKVG